MKELGDPFNVLISYFIYLRILSVAMFIGAFKVAKQLFLDGL